MPNWTLFPDIIVRSPGFPFELLERTRYARAADAARRLAWEISAFEKYKVTAPKLHRPTRELLALLKAGKPIPAELSSDPAAFADWNKYAEAVLAASIEFEDAFKEEHAAAERERTALCNDERFLEAIASSSPPVYLDLAKGRINNRVQRQLGSYLQRFAAKNETMSFFGPINYGRVDPALPDGVSYQWSGHSVLERKSYAASWLVQSAFKRIAQHPEIAPWLVFRRKGFSEAPSRTQRRSRLGDVLLRMGKVTPEQVRDGLAKQASTRLRLGEILVSQGLITVEDVRQALEKQASGSADDAPSVDIFHQLVAAADGQKNARALANELKVDVATVLEQAKIACERGFLTHQLEIPPGVHNPLDDLVERLAAIPGEAARTQLALIGRVLDRMRDYGRAPAHEKVRINDEVGTLARSEWNAEHGAQREKTQQEKERRGEGHNFYADRLPVREECGGDLRLSIGGERAAEITKKCERALEVLAYSAWMTRENARKALAAMLGEREIALWRVLATVSDRPIPYDTTISGALALAIPDPSASVVELSEMPRPQLPPEAEELPIATSVDLLISARSVEEWANGEYEITLGDVHDTILVWGWALQFHEQRRRVETDMLRQLGSLKRKVPLVTPLASRRTGLIPPEFPGPVIEVGGVSGRASSWRLSLDDLFVRSNGQTSMLWSKSLQSEVCLYNGELESIIHTAYALPRIRPIRLSLTPHTPRLTLDGVVMQREQWQFPADAFGPLAQADDDKERLRAALAVWDELGLPEYVFAKFKGERKPLLVDVRNPLLLRVFLNLLEQKQEVVMSEMRPGPGQLWLKDGAQRYTSELRCTFFRTGKVEAK